MKTHTLLPLALVGCAEPDLADLFGQVSVEVAGGEDAASQPFVERVKSAGTSLHVAMPGGDDLELADALVDAWDRGLDVEVITDFDLRDTEAVRRLTDAEVPTTLADDGLTYFEFNLNDDAVFPSESTVMSSAWVVADRTSVLAASTLGRAGSGDRVLFDVAGEDLIDDLLQEHRQVFGGTDATAVTAFDGPAKSITDLRWRYGTAAPIDLEMWFGPQERLTKRVIDAVYTARTSVRILTDDLANEGLAKALQDKAERGFDVEVVVGPRFGQSNTLLSRFFEEAGDVEKRRVTDVDVVPTVVIVDWEPQASGLRSRTQVMVMTHDLYSASRLYRGEPVVTDQLIDGVMWTLSTSSEPDASMEALFDLWLDHHDRSEDL
jgi:sugar-specific transcriptional regulator TrmB